MPRTISSSALLGLGLMLALSLPLIGCSKNEATALADAKARIEKRDAAGAEIELKNLLQTFPKSGEARFLLGNELLKRGEAASALIELERAQELGFDENQVLPMLARAWMLTGKTRRVIDDLAGKTLKDPDANALLQATVASAQAREGDMAGASKTIDGALRDAPNVEVAMLAKAKMLAVQGNPDAAMTAVDELLAKHPKSAEAWALKADLSLRSPGGPTVAIEAYRQALEAQPDQLHSRAAMVALQLSAGKLDDAAKELELLRKSAPGHFSTSFLDAQMAVTRHDYQRARTIYQAMLKVAPDHPMLLVSAAENELRMNALTQAEAMSAKAMTLVPSDRGARRVLAQTLLRKGQADKAAVALAPLADRADATADVLALAAQANLMNGNTKQAEAYYARLSKLKPTDPRLRTIVATSGFNRSSPEAVLSQLQSISNDDSGISADLAIINSHMQARQWAAALKAIEAVQRKQPDKALSYHLKAQVLARSDDLAGARKALGEALAKEPAYMPAVVALAAIDMVEKKPEAAKQRFKALLERDPKNAAALLALAEVAQRTQAPKDEVQRYLKAAVEADPQSVMARLALIDLLVNQGEVRGALAIANAAAVVLPNSIEILDRMARMQGRLGEMDQALSNFGKITTLQPKTVAGHLGQAQVYLATGNLVQAQRSVERVLEREPESLEGRAVQVTIMLGQKNFKDALALARGLQADKRAESMGFQLEAEVASAQSLWDQAAGALRQAVARPNPGMAPVKLYHVLVKAGKAADAETFATDWLRRHPRDTQLMFFMADVAQTSGKLEVAEKRYRELLTASPDHALAMNNLAMLLVTLKKPGAGPLIDKAVQLMPNEPALIDTQAHVRAAAGQHDQAVTLETKAVELAPKSALLRLNLAKFQIDAGNKSDAKTTLTRLADAALQMTEEQRQELRTMLASLSR